MSLTPHLKPLPLDDPELAELTEGQIAVIVRNLWRRYDFTTDRRARGKVIQELSRFVTPEHPVLTEWALLKDASTEQYKRHVRNPRKRELWERKFQEAKSTEGRHWALTNLWKYTTDQHPIVQMYLTRNKHRPSSRKGWWALEPKTK